MEGGGLHQSLPGGFLNIHADFTVHPHHRQWRRRVNLLLYLGAAVDGALLLHGRERPICAVHRVQGASRDGWRALPIYLDKQALRTYDWLKRRFELSDDAASRLLRRVERFGRRWRR